jgi:predicted AAA+ superfamily ATPase
MAHLRPRSLLPIFKKKLNQWPVVCLIGPRQCGKSTFLKELAFPDRTLGFISLDKALQRKSAQSNPELFLKKQTIEPLVLDEIQKVPDLFDEIKSVVDEQRRPGRFVLTGSARFSTKIGIRESLTGRTAVLHMDSMTLRETLNADVRTTNQGFMPLEQILRYAELGGMPIACFHREEALRKDYWDEWLETLCEQDLHAFSKGRLSGDLAHEILSLICSLESPTLSEIARKAGTHARRIQNHIDALEDLFVIHPVEPDANSTGKTRYLIFDCGLAYNLGAPLETRLRTLIHHQWRNAARFKGIKLKSLRYYQHRKGSFFDFATSDPTPTFYRISLAAHPSKREIQKASAQVKRYTDARAVFLSATDEPPFEVASKVMIRPIGSIFEPKSVPSQR